MRTWEAELATLVAERGRALVGYAFALAGDLGQAEDLVQDALVKTFSRPRQPRLGSHVVPLSDDNDAADAAAAAAGVPAATGTSRASGAEAYVRRAILTLFLDDYRRRRRWAERKHLVAETGHSPASDRAATAQADVTAALSRLGQRERAAIVLRHYEDLTVPQIARAMNVAEGTVKRYLADAAAVLRTELGDRDPASPRTIPAPTSTRERDAVVRVRAASLPSHCVSMAKELDR